MVQNGTVEQVIEEAQNVFEKLLLDHTSEGFTKDQYVRYLSMQYHLVRDVHRHFYSIAGHASLHENKNLRTFLITFANEEETHYRVAENDLKAIGMKPLNPPIEVYLWKAFFDSILQTRPFLRLGATCILENIAMKSDKTIERLMSGTSFLTKENSRFVQIHRHQDEAHGAEILSSLKESKLTKDEQNDLYEGSIIGANLFLRMFKWSITPAEQSLITI